MYLLSHGSWLWLLLLYAVLPVLLGGDPTFPLPETTMCPEVQPNILLFSYWIFSSLLNQAQWYIYTQCKGIFRKSCLFFWVVILSSPLQYAPPHRIKYICSPLGLPFLHLLHKPLKKTCSFVPNQWHCWILSSCFAWYSLIVWEWFRRHSLSIRRVCSEEMSWLWRL